MHLPTLLALLALPFAVPPVAKLIDGAGGPELIPVLGDTGRLQLVFGALLTIGLLV
jgi:1,4-dihydroxy-2-naphthoate octaprenyltransferase